MYITYNLFKSIPCFIKHFTNEIFPLLHAFVNAILLFLSFAAISSQFSNKNLTVSSLPLLQAIKLKLYVILKFFFKKKIITWF